MRYVYSIATLAMLAIVTPAAAGECDYLCGNDSDRSTVSHAKADKPEAPDQDTGLGESDVSETDPNDGSGEPTKDGDQEAEGEGVGGIDTGSGKPRG